MCIQIFTLELVAVVLDSEDRICPSFQRKLYWTVLFSKQPYELGIILLSLLSLGNLT